MRDVLRKSRHTLLSRRRWLSRLLLWTAAAGVGSAAVAFAWFADVCQAALRRLIEIWACSPWLLAPIGFFCIGWATRRFFPGAEGSGIPQTIVALRTESEELSRRLMRPLLVCGRVLLAGAALCCGASVGREGPTVHVGAAIAHAFSRWMPHGEAGTQRRVLILAGGAAGVAAAFNTPLAGIVFAIEELSRSFDERASGVTLTAVILAGVIAIALVGEYTYFGHPVVAADAARLSSGVFAVALASGLAGGLFSRTLLAGLRGLPGIFGRVQRDRPALLALGCGLIVALVAWGSGGLTYGSGYVEAKSILEQGAHLPWFYAPARALATLLAYLSGIPTGLFAPSLSVGAGLGQWIGELLPSNATVPLAIVGMCGYLAAVTQAPLTSLVIVMEMTTQQGMVFPLMVTVVIATATSKLLSPPLYRTLAERYSPLPGSE